MPRLGLGNNLANAGVISSVGVVSSYSLDFGGTNEYVEIPDADIFSHSDGTDDSAFSISGWAKIAASDAACPICIKYDDDSPFLGEYSFYLTSGRILLMINNATTIRCYRKADADQAVSTDAWHHFVGVYDGTGADNGDDSIKLYVDGVDITADTTGLGQAGSYQRMLPNTSSLMIGVSLKDSASYNSYATAKIDEVAMFSKALSQEEVTELKGTGSNIGDATEISNLVGYWRMEEGSGTTVADSSGNGNDGTMNNMESGDWDTDGATN